MIISLAFIYRLFNNFYSREVNEYEQIRIVD